MAPQPTLKRPEVAEFCRLLVQCIDIPGLSLILMSLSKDLEEITTSSGLGTKCLEVVQTAEREGWLINLILTTHKETPDNQPICSFVRNKLGKDYLHSPCQTDLAVYNNPFSASFLRPNNFTLPFVNRRDLRDKLTGMFDIEFGARILAVDSSVPLCGKSYTYQLVRFITTIRNQRTAYIDLSDVVLANLNPGEITTMIGKKIKADVGTIPTPEAQTARWNKELCEWLSTEISTTNEFWWIVIDGFNHLSELSVDISDFINELVNYLEEEDQPQFRLILLGYNAIDELPVLLQGRIEQEIIRNTINSNELIDFFKDQVERLQDQNNFSQNDQEEIPIELAKWVIEEQSKFSEKDRSYALEGLISKAMGQLESLVNPIGTV